MDWRSWVYGRLTLEGNPLLSLVPADSIYGAGSLETSPTNKPFIMIRFGAKVRRNPEGPYSQSLELWVHDQPGDFLRIDNIIELLHDQLEGQVGDAGAIVCRWEGDSGDLADEGYGTITRTSSFTLVGNG